MSSGFLAQVDLNDAVPRYTIDTVSFHGIYITRAREVAEGRKDLADCTEDKAGKASAPAGRGLTPELSCRRVNP